VRGTSRAIVGADKLNVDQHLHMKPHILLRTASILTLIHALLHHFGGLTRPPSHGQDEVAVQTAMKSFQMDVMGSLRSYWDFYFGFGFFVTVSLLLLTVLVWQLAALAKSDPAKAGPFMATLFVGFVIFGGVSWTFFFIAPLVTEAIIALLIGLAYVFSRRVA
jgi:hypothetical protein